MRRPFRFWGFRSPDEILENSLGALERAVMAVVWARGETSVHDACAELEPPIAYTTVMTTLDRLFRKGLLARRKSGRRFVYRATASRHEIEGAVASELVQTLLRRDGQALPMLSSLVDAVSAQDRALLDELERLVREKRRALAAGDGHDAD